MSKNAEQCRAIERTLRSHQVLRKVATGGKSLAKFQKKVFDMCAFKAAEPEQLYTIHMSALGLLQLLVQQIPASSLEEIAKKTMQQLVELSKNPANVNLSLRTKICEIHHALAIRLQELPSEVVRDVTSLFGQLIPSAIAALNDAAKVEGALSIESCQHVSHIVNAITVLISECQGTMRQYANKMEKACLSLLFKDGEDIDGNMRPVMQSAAICISMITKNYAKPAEADSNKQSMEWIDVRLNRCLLSLQAMINQAVSGSVSLNELQDFPIIHPVDIDYVSSYGSSITTFVGRFTRLSFLLESYIQRASETQVFFVKAFQPVFDRMLEFARVCLLINANEIGREVCYKIVTNTINLILFLCSRVFQLDLKCPVRICSPCYLKFNRLHYVVSLNAFKPMVNESCVVLNGCRILLLDTLRKLRVMKHLSQLVRH